MHLFNCSEKDLVVLIQIVFHCLNLVYFILLAAPTPTVLHLPAAPMPSVCWVQVLNRTTLPLVDAGLYTMYNCSTYFHSGINTCMYTNIETLNNYLLVSSPQYVMWFVWMFFTFAVVKSLPRQKHRRNW